MAYYCNLTGLPFSYLETVVSPQFLVEHGLNLVHINLGPLKSIVTNLKKKNFVAAEFQHKSYIFFFTLGYWWDLIKVWYGILYS